MGGRVNVVETPHPLYDLRAFDLSEAEFEALLGRLCIRFGFCLSSEAARRVWNKRPETIEEFLNALYWAEGLENDTRRSLRSAIKSDVQQFMASKRRP